MYFRVLIISTLVVFWLVLSGFWTNGLLLGLGAASVALVVWISLRVEKQYPFGNGIRIIHRLYRYMPWFLVEVIKSNINILKSIWMPQRYPISPVMRTLRMQPKTRIGRTIYANSITLTPGTVSVVVRGEDVLIHSLYEDAMDDLEAGEMGRRIYELESHNQELRD